MDMEAQFENKKRELKEVREHKKKLLELQDKTSLNLKANSNLESQLTEKSKQLELCNKKRDNLERELVTVRSEAAGIKRILGNSLMQLIRIPLFYTLKFINYKDVKISE